MSFYIPLVTGGVSVAALTHNSQEYQKVSSIPFGESYRPLSQYLTIDGTGSTASNVTGNYTGSATDFTYIPDSADRVHINRIAVRVGDSGGFVPQGFAALAALTNGIDIGVTNDSDFVFKVNSNQPIKRNLDWNTIGEVSVTPYSETTYSGYTVSIDLSQKYPGGLRLNGAIGDALTVRVNDTFTGLIEHRYLIEGYYENNLNYVS